MCPGNWNCENEKVCNKSSISKNYGSFGMSHPDSVLLRMISKLNDIIGKAHSKQNRNTLFNVKVIMRCLHLSI